MADQTERLLLQVDAATELLRRHLAEGEQPLDRFERRAERMAENVDRSIGDMGKRFGAFAGLADDAAKRAQQSFEASFSQVQRLAATAIKGPVIEGRVNLGAEDIRAGAAAAQEQARSFALIGEAAERTAARVGDTSEATRLFIAATKASRIEADQKATALLAEAGALERVEIELLQSGEAVDLFIGKHQRLAVAANEERRLATEAAGAATQQRALAAAAEIVRAELDPMYLAQKRFNDELDRAEALLAAGVLRQHEYDGAVAQSRATLYAHAQAVTGNVAPTNQLVRSQGALRSAMQGASYQLQDTFTQISMGANILSVVAIQGGQLAGQFANIEGKAGSFARFMIGPYGLAITAALLVLGPLTKGLLDFGDALDEETDKLRENADKSALADQAKQAFLRTEAGAIDDVRALTEELKRQNDALLTNAERLNIRSKNRLQTLNDAKTDIADELEQARDARAAATRSSSQGADVIIARETARIAALEARATRVGAAIAQAEAARLLTQKDLASEAAGRANDPVASINRRYDGPNGLIEQAKKRATAEETVNGVLTRQLTTLKAQQKLEVDREQERQRKAKQKPSASANNQLGREIGLADARAIVEGIGGRVTNDLRSTKRQAELYADKLAGRHIGPVAKPGTSDHERGQALDVAYGPGISIASLRAAFAKQGVALKQILDEPAQRIFHVAFGKRGPSRETIDNRAEAARQKVLANDIAYTDQERAARQRLLAATRRGADSEEQKEAAATEGAQVDRDATRQKIADQLSAKKITVAQADHLNSLNEATYTQQLQNEIVERATRQLDRQYEVAQGDLQSRLAVLRINEDLATTARERRAIARQILDAEQELRRQALQRVRDTSNDPKAVQSAKDELGRLPATEAAENRQFDARSAGALDQYRERLKAATLDTSAALEDIGVRGLGALEDRVASAASKVLGLKGAFGDMVNSAIADLARLAIQKAIVAAIGTGAKFFGIPLADGGPVLRRAGGGPISGPGGPRDDLVPALLSNGEFVVNAAAYARNRELVEAINAHRLPRLAAGGPIRAPRLPRVNASGGGGGRDGAVLVRVALSDDLHATIANKARDVSVEVIRSAAPELVQASTNNTINELRKQTL